MPDDSLNAPLYSALTRHAAEQRRGFHMPGNREGQSFPENVRESWACLESTELSDVTDDLNAPAGPAREAEALAARFWGSGKTLFFTSGSSTAIFAMLAAFCPPGSLLWASPAAHQSLLHAAAFLDLRLRLLPRRPEPSGRSPLGQTDLRALEMLLRSTAERPTALYVVSPDYYGLAENLAALAALGARYGLALLVDEAHGAHFAAAPSSFPVTAMQAGAAAAVQSAHKTLPCLAPGSLLHLHSAALAADPSLAHRAELARRLVQTSSPSFPVGASLDWARAFLEAQGQTLVKSQLRRIAAFRAALSPRYHCYGGLTELPYEAGSLKEKRAPAEPKPVPGGSGGAAGKDGQIAAAGDAALAADPLRVVIDFTARGISRQRLAQALTEAGIDGEMLDLCRLVLIPALDQPAEDYMALARLLNRLAGTDASAAALDTAYTRRLCRPRTPLLQPRSYLTAALHCRQRWTAGEIRAALQAGCDLIALEALVPYPPGIPWVYPGERLETADLDLWAALQEAGIACHGGEEGRLAVSPLPGTARARGWMV